MDKEDVQDSAYCETTPSEPQERPPKPNPSSDAGVVPRIGAPPACQDEPATPGAGFDVATLEPLAALKLLSRGVQALVDMTGDVPPTPPVSRPITPSLSEIRNELSVRPRSGSRPGTPPSRIPPDDAQQVMRSVGSIGSPEAHFLEPNAPSEVSVKLQRLAIARKFFSKKPPPISINDYLMRLHRYCPMSTAVYLAAGVYVHRLAVEDQSVPATVRTVHRLLCSTLRIAMKALEDLSYPHKRFAGVGGVSERELAKLEISVCYLLDFDLRVTNELLFEKNSSLQQIAESSRISVDNFKLKLPMRHRRNRSLTVV